MDRMLCLMLVFFGGGIGCVTRYLLDQGYPHPFTPANILSCFAIGVCYALTRYRVLTNIYYQSFITIGLLGGLSTFTPLAMFALNQSNDTSFYLSFPILLACIFGFFIIATISYNLTAWYLVKVKKIQPLPSIAATIRAHNQNKQNKETKMQEMRKMQEQLEQIKKMAQQEAQKAAELAAKKAAEESYKEAYRQALEKHTKEIKYGQKKVGERSLVKESKNKPNNGKKK